MYTSSLLAVYYVEDNPGKKETYTHRERTHRRRETNTEREKETHTQRERTHHRAGDTLRESETHTHREREREEDAPRRRRTYRGTQSREGESQSTQPNRGNLIPRPKNKQHTKHPYHPATFLSHLQHPIRPIVAISLTQPKSQGRRKRRRPPPPSTTSSSSK